MMCPTDNLSEETIEISSLRLCLQKPNMRITAVWIMKVVLWLISRALLPHAECCLQQPRGHSLNAFVLLPRETSLHSVFVCVLICPHGTYYPHRPTPYTTSTQQVTYTLYMFMPYWVGNCVLIVINNLKWTNLPG